LRITAEDVRRYVEIGKWCIRVEFYYQELSQAELELRKLLDPTPLTYSCTRVRDLTTPGNSSTSQGEQPPTVVDAPEGRPAD